MFQISLGKRKASSPHGNVRRSSSSGDGTWFFWEGAVGRFAAGRTVIHSSRLAGPDRMGPRRSSSVASPRATRHCRAVSCLRISASANASNSAFSLPLSISPRWPASYTKRQGASRSELRWAVELGMCLDNRIFSILMKTSQHASTFQKH